MLLMQHVALERRKPHQAHLRDRKRGEEGPVVRCQVAVMSSGIYSGLARSNSYSIGVVYLNKTDDPSTRRPAEVVKLTDI